MTLELALIVVTLAATLVAVAITISQAMLLRSIGLTNAYRTGLTVAVVWSAFAALYAALLVAGVDAVPREWFRPAIVALVASTAVHGWALNRYLAAAVEELRKARNSDRRRRSVEAQGFT